MPAKNAPTLPRRAPNGLDIDAQRVLGAKAAASGVSLQALAAVILEDAHDGREAAEAFVADQAPFDARCCYWSLLQHERQQRAGEIGTELRSEHPAYAAVERVAAVLRERFVYARFRDEVFDRAAVRPGAEKRGEWVSLRALDNSMKSEMPEDPDNPGEKLRASDVLLEDPRAHRVHDEIYAPGNENEIIVDEHGVGWLNTWTRPDIVPAPGDPSPMLKLIHRVLNEDQAAVDHLLDWCAFVIQHPDRRINHAPLIISEQTGVGKDTIIEALGRVIGLGNFAQIGDEALAEGRFDFMRNNRLVFAPEVMCGDRRDIMNKLKPLITQPRIRINEKNVKPYVVRNHVNFAFASNYPNAAYIDSHDRRFWVIISNAGPMDEDFAREIYDYVNDPARLAGYAHFLATRDISHFNPYARAPFTADKAVVQKEVRPAWESWLDELWSSGMEPFHHDVVRIVDVMDAIAAHRGAPKITVNNITRFLKQRGGGDLGVKSLYREINDKQPTRARYWAIQRFDEIKELSNEDLGVLARTSHGFRVDDLPRLRALREKRQQKVVGIDHAKEIA